VASACEVLKGLPDGSVIEFDTVYDNPDRLKEKTPIGLHRYKGAVKRGNFAIDEYFPPAPVDRLNAALALSAQVEKESEIDAGDEESATAILAYLKKHPFFSDNPAVKKGATSIAMKAPEPAMLNFVAAEVFARKFKDAYPLFSFQDDDDEEEEEIEEEKPAGPPIGELILKGADGRTFHASDAAKMPEAVAARMAEYEKELLPLGFKFVADIVVKPLQNILLRGYAQDGGSVWGAVMLYMNGGGMPEFVMSFPKHATLSVTRNITAADELYRNAFKKSRQKASLKEMFAEMEQRSAFLAQHFGKPAAVTATAKGLAEDVEASFKRQKTEAPAPGHELLLRGDDGRRHFSADATLIDASAAKVFGDADKAMRELGYKPVGDVVSTFLTSYVVRGYAKPGSDTWFKFQAEASSTPQCAGFWELATLFEKGASLVTTRRAMHKDEPKRKIFRILDDKPPETLLKMHEERKAKLAEKYGKPVPIAGDLKGLAAEVEAAFVRLMG
jgi:hypothetical protein